MRSSSTVSAPVADQSSPRLLVVVAHPDDETFGCGSILRSAADEGMVTAVLCATRGEAGESAIDVAPGELASVREAETRAAGEVLGVSQIEFLDFHDSGMSGPAGDTTLVAAPINEVAHQIRERIEAFRPDVVVTLDAGDGHRDHAHIRDATLAAVDAADWTVTRVYLQCLPQSLMRRWVDYMAANDPSWEHLSGEMPGTPDESITTALDTSGCYGERLRAIAVHASQRSPFEGLPEDLRRAFLTRDSLIQARPVWPGGPVETALLPAKG
jgi:LmbE family N-acetylglucosaminyl deacetylase